MKKILLLFTILYAFQASAVALKVIEETKVTFHNYSNSYYDVSGHIISIGSEQFGVDTLPIISGSLNTSAGSYLVIGGLTIPKDDGAVTLWTPLATFPSPYHGDLVDFVQWGSYSGLYVQQAFIAGRWVDPNVSVVHSLPIHRSDNYTTWGHSVWSAGLSNLEMDLKDLVSIYPVAFTEQINLDFLPNHSFNYLAVYDLSGNRIFGDVIDPRSLRFVIQSGHYKKGIYLLELISDSGESYVIKLLKI